jgi:DNA-binding NarL/FixJ family response regulator
MIASCRRMKVATPPETMAPSSTSASAASRSPTNTPPPTAPTVRSTGARAETIGALRRRTIAASAPTALSEKTVRNVVSTVFSKLPAESRPQAIAMARDAGLGGAELP